MSIHVLLKIATAAASFTNFQLPATNYPDSFPGQTLSKLAELL
jgi:hypothetical protein